MEAERKRIFSGKKRPRRTEAKRCVRLKVPQIRGENGAKIGTKTALTLISNVQRKKPMSARKAAKSGRRPPTRARGGNFAALSV
jgi:hypothetical protein